MSLRAKRNNLFNLRDCFVALLLIMTVNTLSQDRINFKLYDSLKTYAGDNHTKFYFASLDTNDSKEDEPIVIKDKESSWDVRLFRKINNHPTPFKDRFLNTFDRSMLPVGILLPTTLFIYGRSTGKNLR